MKLAPVLTLLTLTGFAIGATGVALASVGTRDNDAARDLAAAKVGIEQAIQTAQAASGGRATAAELDGEHGRLIYEVEVVTPKRGVLEVSVDALSGKVLAQRNDPADGEDAAAEANETDRD